MKHNAKARLLAAAVMLLALGQLFPQTMNPRVRAIPKELQEQVFVTPEETLPKLTASLVSGVSDTTTRLRILHDWICDNIAYDTDIFFKDRTVPEQTYQNVLLGKKAICYGYSNLFKKMCNIAGIECEVVSGWSKGENYPGYVRYRGGDHAWNKVKVGANWQLVDVTWDAGNVNWHTYYRRYSTDYFLLAPSKFIFQHLPEHEEDQLLPKGQVRSVRLFEKEPYIPGHFFAQGFSFVNGSMPDFTHFITKRSAVEIKPPSTGTVIFANMKRSSDSSPMEGLVFAERKNGINRILYDVPDTQKYKVSVFSFDPDGKAKAPSVCTDTLLFEQTVVPCAQKMLELGEISQEEYDAFKSSYFYSKENGSYYLYEDLFDTKRNALLMKIEEKAFGNSIYAFQKLFSFEVLARYDYEGCRSVKPLYPTPYLNYHKTRNTQLVSPLSAYLKSGTGQKISLYSTDYSNFRVYIGEDFFQMKKNPKTSCWECEITVPPKDKAGQIIVYGSSDAKSYNAVYGYDVVDKEPSLSPSDAELAAELKQQPLVRAQSLYEKGNESFKDVPVAETANLFRRGIHLMEQAFGKQDLRLADYYLMAGSSYSEMQDYDSALECFKRQLQIQGSNPDRNRIMTAYYNCELTCDKMNDKAGRLSYLEQGIKHFEGIGAEARTKDGKLIACILYKELGIDVYNKKDFEKAYSAFEKSLSLSIDLYGEDSESSARGYYLLSLAQVYKASYVNEFEEAVRLCTQSVTIYRKLGKQDTAGAQSAEQLLKSINEFLARQQEE